MLMEPLVPQRSQGVDESLADFVRRRLGREALDRLVQPLVGGIYTSDPEQLSLAATMPRFLDMERESGSLLRATMWPTSSQKSAEPSDSSSSGARYGLFAGFAGGMEDLVTRLRSVVEARCHVRVLSPIQEIRTKGPAGGYQLIPRDLPAESFDAVILATTAYRAASLLRGIDSSLAAELDKIDYASSAIVVTGHQLKDIRHPLNSFGLVVPHRERRRILATSFSSRKFPDRAPPGGVLLRTFVGGAMQPELYDLDDDQIEQFVREELAEIFGVQGPPELSLLVRYPRAMPQYLVGHLDRVSRIEQLVQLHSGLALAGNYLRGVGVPDSIASGESAAASVATPRS